MCMLTAAVWGGMCNCKRKGELPVSVLAASMSPLLAMGVFSTRVAGGGGDHFISAGTSLGLALPDRCRETLLMSALKPRPLTCHISAARYGQVAQGNGGIAELEAGVVG